MAKAPIQERDSTKGCLKLTVQLNGTDTNPFLELWGLKQNPFPQIAKHEYSGFCLHLAKLGADPIPDITYIRDHLKGWETEFVELCCAKFEKGKMVKFDVYFPDPEYQRR